MASASSLSPLSATGSSGKILTIHTAFLGQPHYGNLRFTSETAPLYVRIAVPSAAVMCREGAEERIGHKSLGEVAVSPGLESKGKETEGR